MKMIILLLLFSASLYCQQFVVRIMGIEEASSAKIEHDPYPIIKSNKDISVDPNIVIPDTIRYKIDPEIRVNMSSSTRSQMVTLYVLQKSKDGTSELKDPSTDDLLKFSNITSKTPPPKKNGYFILIENDWRPYNNP